MKNKEPNPTDVATLLKWLQIRYNKGELTKRSRITMKSFIRSGAISMEKLSTIEKQYFDIFNSEGTTEQFLAKCLKTKEQMSTIEID